MSECAVCNRNCPPVVVDSLTGERRRAPDSFSRRHWTSKPLENYRAAKMAKLADQEAIARENARERAKRGDKGQLAHLDKILGKGKGAKKERARLKHQMENPTPKKAKAPRKRKKKNS